MFGFHTRSRSLIPVKDLEKVEKLESVQHVEIRNINDPEEAEVQAMTSRQRRNLIMIYFLFLAEAIMASSLSSQIEVLLPSASGCLSMNSSFLRSILQCSYFFGSVFGIVWGFAADRLGRRKVALIGLTGMGMCCISMGFATTFIACAALRYVSGAISSAVTVSALAMLADITHGNGQRTQIVSLLPVVTICGQLGPFLSTSIGRFARERIPHIFVNYPGLGSQIACAGLVFSITLAQVCFLDETLPSTHVKEIADMENGDCEKAAFLTQDHHEPEGRLSISIIEALNDDAAAPLPSRISITQMLTAPSVLILLASFSALSLHSSTFEVLLPHIGHTASHNGGMGIACSWLAPLMLIVQVIAALRIMHFVPETVSKIGLLPMYRTISMAFPVLYILIPTVAILVNISGTPTIVTAAVSVAAIMTKAALAGAAQVLVLLLVLSAAPDASSTGTLIGIVSISELFKAFAVGATGISYYLSGDYSVLTVNGSLWAMLVLIASIGALITRRLRETPRVGTDIPEECLNWQGMFDAESDDGQGF